MLKIQELQIDDVTYRIREPRLRDYLEAKKAPDDQYSYALLGTMLLDENDKEMGLEGILDLPLRVIDQLNVVVARLSEVQTEGPLTQTESSPSS